MAGAALIGALIAPGAVVASGAAPVLYADTITTDQGVAVSGNVLANDTDPENDPLVVTTYVPIDAAYGVLAIATDGSYTFTPHASWSGSTSTWYGASDGTRSRMATINITVNAVNNAPVALDKQAQAIEDTPVDLGDAFLLDGATDVDGDTITVTGVSGATGGTAGYAAGTATFTPAANLCGAAAGGFDYAVSDGLDGTDTAHVTVDIACVNDAPDASDDTITVVEDTVTDVTSAILANDSDPDGDLVIGAVDNATGGTVELAAGAVTFTPTAELCGAGAGSFEYTLADSQRMSYSATVGVDSITVPVDSATVTVDITCVNDLVAGDDDASGTEDTDLVLSSAALTANDIDPKGSSLTIDAVDNASGGTAVVEAGTVTFTPAENLCGVGVASFDYTMTDGTETSTPATVTISLTCVNDAPVAVADRASVTQGSGAADYDVMDNDTDVEGDTLTLEDASVSAAAGTASVAGGMVRFTPLGSFHGAAVITYTISDGTDTATGTLTVTVGSDVTAPTVTAPVAVFGTGSIDESAPINLRWGATDAGSGVASYTVQVSVSDGPFATIYTGAATSTTKWYGFNKRLVWRVQATDNAGNTSGWATSAARRIYSYQAPGVNPIVYSGTWTTVTSAGSSGVGFRYTSTLGKWAQLTFTGREVLYVAPKTWTSGTVKVYVDGVLQGSYPTYRASAALGQIIARASWGGTGSHTIRVVNGQGGKRASLDAFIVLR